MYDSILMLKTKKTVFLEVKLETIRLENIEIVPNDHLLHSSEIQQLWSEIHYTIRKLQIPEQRFGTAISSKNHHLI